MPLHNSSRYKLHVVSPRPYFLQTIVRDVHHIHLPFPFPCQLPFVFLVFLPQLPYWESNATSPIHLYLSSFSLIFVNSYATYLNYNCVLLSPIFLYHNPIESNITHPPSLTTTASTVSAKVSTALLLLDTGSVASHHLHHHSTQPLTPPPRTVWLTPHLSLAITTLHIGLSI